MQPAVLLRGGVDLDLKEMVNKLDTKAAKAAGPRLLVSR
jgi:hypothetical protein